MWINITEDDLPEVLTGPEITAIQTAALKTDQTNPLPQAVADAIQMVRGRVAACLNNILGSQEDGYVIPQELRRATLSIAAYYACSRVPAGLVNTERKTQYADALRLLEQVAACEFRLEQPIIPTTQHISGPAMELVRVAPERASRFQTRGL